MSSEDRMVRLRDDGGSDIERRLLASAADDEMPEASYRALVKWGAGAAPTSAASPTRPTWKLTVAKGLGLLALTVVSVGVVQRLSTGTETAATPPSDAHATSPIGATGPALAEDRPEHRAPSSGDVVPVVSLDQLPSAPGATPSSTSPKAGALRAAETRPTADADGDAFAEQLKLIDSARTQLRRDDPQGAITVLDEYERRFAAGAFAEEATVLRISALAKAGDHARARRIGEAFLSGGPSEIYRRRVETAVRALGDQKGTP